MQDKTEQQTKIKATCKDDIYQRKGSAEKMKDNTEQLRAEAKSILIVTKK